MANSINANFFNNYSNYSNMFTTSSSSQKNIFQLSNELKLYSNSNAYNILGLKYGVNNAQGDKYTATSETVKSLGSDLSSTISELTAQGKDSLFNNYSATSTDSKVATATVDNTKLGTAKNLSSVELDVKQVATAQVNSGNSLKSANLEKAVNAGRYDFEIEVNGKTQQFSVNVSYADNNQSIQEKMAAAINGKNLGVTASVSYDSSNKTSQLSLTSAATGNQNTDGSPVFSVRDVNGDLASQMGITQISQQAQNAVYSVNGGQQKTSASNNIDLGNGVTATVKEAGTATLNFQKNGSDSISKVKDLVNSLNSALTAAFKGDGQGSDKLGNDISTMNKSYSTALSKVGINVSTGGYLSINEDKLKLAAQDGSLEKLLQKGSGFAARAGRIADNMATSNYYADSYIQNNSNNSWSNFSNYSSYGSVGLLFDSMF